MNKEMIPELKELIDVVHYQPAISIITPLLTPAELNNDVFYSLKIAVDKVEKELRQNYPENKITAVIQKLKSVVKTIKVNTAKKSVAIFVSPVFEKVVYLDIAVEEKIIIDESFEIRDLVYSKKQLHNYLVLLFSAKESRIYLGNTESFVKLVSSKAASAMELIRDEPERVANFSDTTEKKEILMDKFLHHIDTELSMVLSAYQLPLFVIGTEKMLGHFKSVTKHKEAVVNYIHGNYDEAGFNVLKELLQPYIKSWQKSIQLELLKLLDAAAGAKKIATGMKAVWHEAMNNNGKLLVVEKNYMYAAQHGSKDDLIYEAVEPFNKFSSIKDAVDDVIERVLEKGGDVEFVDKGMLSSYNQIALIQYY